MRMKKLICYIIFLLILPSLTFAIEISFKNDALVSGSVLTLGDVAVVSPYSKAEVLSKLALFAAPAAGEKKCFNSSTLKSYILEGIINKESVRWSGAENVCVMRKGKAVSRNEKEAETLADVVVASEKLSRGTVISQKNIMIKVENIAELINPCLDPETVIGKRLKRSINMNRVISEDDLEMPVLIERREMVTMLLEKGGLQISTKGMALSNGKLGDAIMVKNQKSNREVLCRVIGPGMTRVNF